MSLDVMTEILDLLKSPGGMRANVAAPIGKSNDPYYQTHYWKDFVWKYMIVVAVQRNQDTGELTSVILAPVDISQPARDMGEAFPLHQVQLEGKVVMCACAQVRVCNRPR